MKKLATFSVIGAVLAGGLPGQAMAKNGVVTIVCLFQNSVPTLFVGFSQASAVVTLPLSCAHNAFLCTVCWLTASFTSGTVPPTVTVTFTVNACGFSPGSYLATISFSNTASGQGNTTRGAALTVNPGTKDDCKDGGWQNFICSPGPFKNQGQCVSHFAK